MENVEQDKVACPICGRAYSYINNFHLKTHGYNSEKEFLLDYPNFINKSKSTRTAIAKHISERNSNHELQSMSARKGWQGDEVRRLEKSQQMQQVSYDLHHASKYAKVRERIYKNRWGIKQSYTDGVGRQFTFRSKIELNTAKVLDRYKIGWEYETIEIPYFDTQQQKERLYLIDFYIKAKNLILECKHSSDIEKQLVQDKKIACERLGYKFLFVDECLSRCPNKLFNTIQY